MYLRWKDGPGWLRVSLVRSVRRNGQPRQEILGSFSVRQDGEGRAALAWNMLEDQLTDMALAANDREKMYQLFARRIPRPSDDELQARRLQSEQHEARRQEMLRQYFGEDWQQRPVVSSTPPVFRDEPLHENEPHLITWKVEPAAPKFHKPAVYTAFLARGVLASGCKPLKLGDIPAPVLAGTISSDGKTVVSHKWQTFWYDTHHALILAEVTVDAYHQVMSQLAHWVKRPTREEMVLIVEHQLYWERSQLTSRIAELDRAMRRALSKSEAQRAVLSRSPEYLGVEAIQPHWVTM